MAENQNETISPTFEKVLDEYLKVLHLEENIDSAAADRLEVLLQKGNIPKFDEIDAALIPPPEGDET